MAWRCDFTFPGVDSVYAFDYTAGLGISPGVINVQCHPASFPGARGNLTFGVTDGATTRTITLADCLLDEFRGTIDSSNQTLRLRLYDRRWSWGNIFAVDGHFNQSDRHTKLRPKTVRSLWQLAALLFKAMGEDYPASASAALTGDGVTAVTVHDGGKGFTSPPTVTFFVGTAATGTAVLTGDGVSGISFTSLGSGYVSAPTIAFTGGGGSGATATATISGGQIEDIVITAPGTGYTSPPTVTFTGGFPVSATATATLTGDVVTSIAVTSSGSGYVTPPRVIVGVPGGYAVDVQPGLAAPSGPNVPAPGPDDEVIDAKSDFLRCGENFTRSRSNPVVIWTSTPAAVALAQLVEQFGRAVVFDPLTDSVSIQQLGDGDPLPAGRLLASSPAIDLEAVPSEVIARGGPTRYQIHLQTRAVLRDHRGFWVPLNESSIAPEIPVAGRKMLAWARISDYSSAVDFSVVINGVTFTCLTGSHATAADVYVALFVAINASTDPRVLDYLAAVASSPVLKIEGDENGYDFDLTATPGERWALTCPVGPIPDGTPRTNEWDVVFRSPPTWLPISDTVTVTVNGTPYTSVFGLTFDKAVADVANKINRAAAGYECGNAGGGHLIVSGDTPGTAITVAASATAGTARASETQTATIAARGFHLTDTAAFPNVKVPTEFLNYEEARNLAKATAHRCFQIVAVNPADPADKSIPMPDGIDPITDITLIQLLDSRVEQSAPRPGDANTVDPATGQPYASERYDGYSNDRPAAVYGSINVACFGGILYRLPGSFGLNSIPTRQIHQVGISVVDPERGVIQFDRPVYRVFGEGNNTVTLPAEPVLEIGVLVLDPATYTPRRFEVSVAIPGATAPPVVRTFDDVREEVIGEYDANHVLMRWRSNDDDPRHRAETYAGEVAASYQAPASETRTYNNMEGVTLSGVVRMVMWAFSAAGFSTVASANSEFTRAILDYGERRRRENEPPDARRSLENFMSQPAVRAIPQNVAQAVRDIFHGLNSRL
jgi:hypothetical protein